MQGLPRFVVGVLGSALCCTIGACGSSEPSKESCVPGERVVCVGDNGCSGRKICRADGTFAACACGADSGAAGNAGSDSAAGNGGNSNNGGRSSGVAGQGTLAGGTSAAAGTGGSGAIANTGGTNASSAGTNGGTDAAAGSQSITGGSAIGSHAGASTIAGSENAAGTGGTAGNAAFGGTTNGAAGNAASGGTTSSAGAGAVGATGSATAGAAGNGAAGGSSRPFSGSCASPTGGLKIVNTAHLLDLGATTIVIAESAMAVPIAEIDLRFCFHVLSAVPASPASHALKIYGGAIQNLSVSPYYVNLNSAPVSVDTRSDGAFCFFIDLHQAVDANAVTLSGRAEIMLDWTLDTAAIGQDAMVDPTRPHPIVVTRNGVVAACAEVEM